MRRRGLVLAPLVVVLAAPPGRGRVERGDIAVTTTAGKPLVYTEVLEVGAKSRLHTSRGCS